MNEIALSSDLANFGRSKPRNESFFPLFFFILLRVGKYIFAGSADTIQLKLAINKGIFPSPLFMFTLQSDRDNVSN